jgi:hypothetical protein
LIDQSGEFGTCAAAKCSNYIDLRRLKPTHRLGFELP